MSTDNRSKALSQDQRLPIIIGWMLTASAVAIASWAGLYFGHGML
jgi:hypothetical protein